MKTLREHTKSSSIKRICDNNTRKTTPEWKKVKIIERAHMGPFIHLYFEISIV